MEVVLTLSIEMNGKVQEWKLSSLMGMCGQIFGQTRTIFFHLIAYAAKLQLFGKLSLPHYH